MDRNPNDPNYLNDRDALDRDAPLDDLHATRRELADDEARLTLSEEELRVGKREVQAGEVGVRKTVETEHVARSVPVTREEVTIERHAITEPMAGDARIGEESIRVPLREEEVVAEKRVVPREELVVRKHEVQEERQVEADLHRERVDVRTEGNVTDRVTPREDRDLR